MFHALMDNHYCHSATLVFVTRLIAKDIINCNVKNVTLSCKNYKILSKHKVSYVYDIELGDYEENGYKTNVDIPYIAQF